MPTMTNEQSQLLYHLALRVRNHQKDYFKKPIVGKLLRAKCSEKELDALLIEISGQRNLFNTHDEDVETETHS